ncbi:hypothetical protein LMG26684_03764 [Achromobacter mucicolens]|uniref:hypothetical protein n=1 Tax=Achromobacter mucicolens TaxID=1389922 RepID=UPI001467762A|nr:hypothetical protein [Achromobacter mucicolens]CAB3884578.1 hypothetical protein LMG26684_03764 [Achromobacter mucicolens]
MPFNRPLVSSASLFCVELILAQSCRAESIGVTIDSFSPLIWGRSIERIVIVLICAASIGLGFFLFKVSARETGEMLARGQGFELKLTRIGPGVLFCLFGIAGLIYTIHTQPTLSFAKTPTGASTFDYAGGLGLSSESEKTLIKSRLEALNFAIDKAILNQSGEGVSNSANQAIAILRAWREDLIMQVVGEEKYSKYLFAERNKLTVKPESDPNLRAIYDQIETLRTEATRQE